MSSYFGIFRSIFQTAVDVWPKRRIRWTFLADFANDMRQYGRISSYDITTVCTFAVVFTLLRSILTTYVFKPFAASMKFTPKNNRKFPESMWKFLYYFTMYIYTCVVLFGKHSELYEDPRTCWSVWAVGMSIPSDIYYLYCIQASFYIHSIYATLFMDTWRKDSIAMIIHHFLTVFLLCFSFAVRYYKVGVLVLFLHDLCDVFLEFTKLCVCWKTRNNKKHYWPSVLINVGFLAFSFSWFYFRLYVFPYKVLYPSGHYAVGVLPHAPFYYFFNGLLLFLFSMNLWWFHFIILLIWRVATGKSPEVEDVREVGTPQEEQGSEDIDSHQSKRMNGTAHLITNGSTKDSQAITNGYVQDIHWRQRQTENASDS
ncbi:ceramide synthase 1-like [Paramuricea clavata]|uniref:Ceramide synthase 1-like n=1 Tax=Paramuricea clavata TaxID=317549 RepID=A0A6S7J0B3_PARCT|nr:ceramide synthase 1-like [Paramuricea clavata]